MRQVRFSALKHVGQSLAHYKHYVDSLNQPRRRLLDVGTVAHSMVLGGGKDVVVYPGNDGKKPVRNGKVWEAFAADNADKLILLPSEYEAAIGCAESVRRHKAAMYLLEGERELELKPWRIGDRECGGRVDCINDQRRRVVELKTAASSDPWRFVRYGLKLAYHSQLAWYGDGHNANGGNIDQAFIVAVESTPPYVVTCFEVAPRALEVGRRIYRAWFEKLLVAERGDFWPGYRQITDVFDIDDEDDDGEVGADLDYGPSAELEEVA